MTRQPASSDQNSFFLAWCLELNKLVYAKDVPLLKDIYDPKHLSFACFVCEQPLIFQENQDKEQNLVPGFVQKERPLCKDGSDEDPLSEHRECLKSLSRVHDIFLNAFENAFLQVEVLQQETHKALSILEEAFVLLRKSVFIAPFEALASDDPSPAEILKKIEVSLGDVISGHGFCCRDLEYLQSSYKMLRKSAKGFRGTP